MLNSAWSVLECVSLSDGQYLFVLCIKRSVSVSVCWDVCHLMTVFLCICVCLPGCHFVNGHLWACVCAHCQLGSVCPCVIAQLVKNLPAMQNASSIPGLGRSAGEGNAYPLQYSWASLVAQLGQNPPAVWKTWVRSLGWEDPWGKGKATHSSILV